MTKHRNPANQSNDPDDTPPADGGVELTYEMGKTAGYADGHADGYKAAVHDLEALAAATVAPQLSISEVLDNVAATYGSDDVVTNMLDHPAFAESWATQLANDDGDDEVVYTPIGLEQLRSAFLEGTRRTSGPTPNLSDDEIARAIESAIGVDIRS
jgi:hypothetical protein